MTKCRVSTVSKNYAKALLDVADEFNSLDLIKTQLDDIESVLQSSRSLREAGTKLGINASTVSRKIKQYGIDYPHAR